MENNDSSWMPDYIDLIQSQRKLGYTIEAAIADIADNPYDAGATHCNITIKHREASAQAKAAKVVEHIIFADNGRGMSQKELRHALIPASTGRERKFHNELGYFGCGLIASGLSLGKRIEIYTRGVDGDLYSYLDWNEKLKTNSPVNLVRPCSTDESKSVLDSYLRGSKTGTVVWISNLELVHKRYDVLMSEIHYHLATTYYNLRDKYSITVNNIKVEPWDFLEKDASPEVSEVKTYTVTRDDKGKPIRAEIQLQMSYVKENNPSRKYEIMGRTNDNQGGALVRYGRMLTRGDMMGIEKKNPAHNALRFQLSYNDHILDDHVFKLTVQKDKCLIQDKDFKLWLDSQVKEFIKTTIKPLNEKYRVHNSPKTTVKTSGSTNRQSIAQVRVKAVISNPIIVKLKGLDVNKIAPFDALKILGELANQAKAIDETASN